MHDTPVPLRCNDLGVVGTVGWRDDAIRRWSFGALVLLDGAVSHAACPPAAVAPRVSRCTDDPGALSDRLRFQPPDVSDVQIAVGRAGSSSALGLRATYYPDDVQRSAEVAWFAGPDICDVVEGSITKVTLNARRNAGDLRRDVSMDLDVALRAAPLSPRPPLLSGCLVATMDGVSATRPLSIETRPSRVEVAPLSGNRPWTPETDRLQLRLHEASPSAFNNPRVRSVEPAVPSFMPDDFAVAQTVDGLELRRKVPWPSRSIERDFTIVLQDGGHWYESAPFKVRVSSSDPPLPFAPTAGVGLLVATLIVFHRRRFPDVERRLEVQVGDGSTRKIFTRRRGMFEAPRAEVPLDDGPPTVSAKFEMDRNGGLLIDLPTELDATVNGTRLAPPHLAARVIGRQMSPPEVVIEVAGRPVGRIRMAGTAGGNRRA
jgi:hypothetical protein